jgi:predicted small secreted protein
MNAFPLLLVAVVSFFFTGCNTFKGVGEDISGAANWTQEKMGGTGGSSRSSDADYVQNPPQFPKAN